MEGFTFTYDFIAKNIIIAWLYLFPWSCNVSHFVTQESDILQSYSGDILVLLQAARQLPQPPSPPGVGGSADSLPGADKVNEGKEAGEGAADHIRSSLPNRGRH
jgi:hypothetical protein